MNILIITPSFFPVRGGGEQLVYDLARKFSGDNKLVILTPRLQPSKKIEILGNIKIYRFPLIRFSGLDALSAQLSLLYHLPKILKKESIDLIHMYHIYLLGGAVILIKKIKKIPLITSLIGWDTYDPIKSVPRFLWPYLSWIMNNSEALLSGSRHMASHAKLQGCKKHIKVIPHGTNMLNIKPSGLDIREKYNLRDEKIVLSIQRLFPRKGLSDLIQAVPLVIKQNPKVKFIIGGKGPEKEKLIELAEKLKVKDKIIFAGFIPDEDLKNYYQQADLFTLPSLYEGFGIVYVDALINGTPIVATKCGGPDDIVNENNGFLVPVGNSQALAEAILTGLEKKWGKKKIKKDALKYSWDNVFKEYMKVYENVLRL